MPPPRRAGLAFGSQQLQSMGLGLPSDPNMAFDPARASTGTSQLAMPFAPTDQVAPPAGLQDFGSINNLINLHGQILEAGLQAAQPPPAPTAPQVYFSQSTGRLHVGGFTFNENNASDALRAYELFDQLQEDSPPPDDAEDWRPLRETEFHNYINEIVNPDLGRLFGEGWQRGMRGLGVLAGAGMQWVGMEERGQALLDEMARGYERDAPFQRQFTDIEDIGDFGEWVASGLGEAAPSIIEGIAAMVAGGAVGGATGGAPGAIGGALAGAFGRGEIKRRVLRGLVRYRALPAELRRQPINRIQRALAERGVANAGQIASDIDFLRRTGVATGAVAGSLANSLGIGTADVYNELREVGAGADDNGARVQALLSAIPYAFLESASELLLGAAAGGVLHGPANLLRGRPMLRTAGYGAGGVAGEALAEGGQEAIVTGAGAAYSGQEWLTPENRERIINAAAVGGLAGGVMGVAAGVTQDMLAPRPLPPEPPPTTEEATPTPPPGPGPEPEPESEPEPDPFAGLQPFELPSVPGAGTAPTFGEVPTPVPPVPATPFDIPYYPGQEVITESGEPSAADIERGNEFLRRGPAAQQAAQDTVRTQRKKFNRTRGFGRRSQQSEDARSARREAEAAVAARPPPTEEEVATFYDKYKDIAPLIDIETVDTGERFTVEPATAGTTYHPRGKPLTAKEGDILVRRAETGEEYSVVEANQFEKSYQEAEGDTWQSVVGRRAQYFIAPEDMDVPSREGWNEGVKKGDPVIKDALGQYAPPPDTFKKKYKRVEETVEQEDRGVPKSAKLMRGAAKPRATPSSRVSKAAARAQQATEAQAPPSVKKKMPRTVQSFIDEADAAVAAGEAKSPESYLNRYNLRGSLTPQERVSLNEARRLLKERKKGKADAVRKSKAKKVDARQQTGNGETLGGRGQEETQAEEQEETDAEIKARDLATIREMLRDVLRWRKNPLKQKKAQADLIAWARVHRRTWQEEATAHLGEDDATFSEDERMVIESVNNAIAPASGRFMRGKPVKLQAGRTEREAHLFRVLSALEETGTLPKDWMERAVALWNDYVDAKDFPEAAKFNSEGALYEWIRQQSKAPNELGRQAKRFFLMNQRNSPKPSIAAKAEQDLIALEKGGKFRRSKDAQLRVRSDGLSANVLNGLWSRMSAFLLKNKYPGLEGLRVHIVNNVRELLQEAPDLADAAAAHSQYYIDAKAEGRQRFRVESLKLPPRLRPRLERKLERSATFQGVSQFYATLAGAAGYAFTANDGTHHVILIANNMYSIKDAMFVMLHELIGHVGVRGVYTEGGIEYLAKEVSKLPNIQARMRQWERDYPGDMDTLELIEEALADELADIESSFVRRAIAAIKDFIEDLAKAIGVKFKFDDSTLRTILANSRAYIQGRIPRKPFVRVEDTGGTIGRFARRGTGVKRQKLKKTAEEKEAAKKEAKAKREAKKAKQEAAEDILQEAANVTTQELPPLPGHTVKGMVLDAYNQAKRLVEKKDNKLAAAVSAVTNELEAMSNKAKRSYGIEKLLDLARNVNSHARTLLGEFRDLRPYTQWAGEFNWLWKLYNKEFRDPVTSEMLPRSGLNAAELKQLSQLLAASTLYTHPQMTEEKIDAEPDLYKVDPATGRVIMDKAVFDAMWRQAILTTDQIREGVRPYTGNGKAQYKEAFKLDLTRDSPVYRAYVTEMHAVAYAQLKVLESKLEEMNAITASSTSSIVRDLATEVSSLKDSATRERFRQWTADVLTFYLEMTFENWHDLSYAQRTKQQQKAKDFLAKVLQALHNDETIKDWMDPGRQFNDKKMNAKDKLAFDLRYEPKYKTMIDRMPEMRRIGMTQEQQISMLRIYNDAALARIELEQAHRFAKHSIAGGYVPIYRKGKYEVRMVPKRLDKDGKPGERLGQGDIHRDALSILPYYRFEKKEDAAETAAAINAAMGNRKITLYDAKLDPVEVVLVPEYGSAAQSGTLVEEVSYASVLRVMRDLGFDPDAETRTKLANALASIEERRRAALRRAGQPGFDTDIVSNINEHLLTMAHYASKLRLRRLYNIIMSDRKNWVGDETMLRDLEKKLVEAMRKGNPAATRIAEDDLLRYARQFSYMSPIEVGNETFTIQTSKGEKKYERRGEGQRLEEEAKRWLTWLESLAESAGLEYSDEDILTKLRWPRLLAVMLQLGGNLASAIVNGTSPWIFTMAYLAGRNEATGVGGGFGEARVFAELVRVYTRYGDPKWADRQFLDRVYKEKKWEEHGLTKAEMLMLIEETRGGVLQAAQTLSFTGGEVARLRSVLGENMSQAWMYWFVQMEMINRRMTAIVTHRLYAERMVAAGADPNSFTDPESANYQKLKKYIEETVFDTQGDYAMANNPHLFRDSYMNYLLMYKKFPIFMTLLMYHLPTSGQIKLLALLTIMAGLKGLPFSDDLMDLIDGAMQKFGIKRASVELEITRLVDTIAPGMGRYAMRGVLDQWLGATWSTRMGFGDLIPFTGVLREGVSMEHELEGALGPVYAANKAALEYAGLLTAFAAQTAGLQDRTLTGADLIRRAPSAGVRTLEGFLYMADGTVRDREGRVISEDPGFLTIASRFLGFYPAEATRMYDTVRLSRYQDNYIRVIKSRYVLAWANAYVNRDGASMRRIENDVREYNAAMRRAGRDDWLINEFRNAALLAGQRARMSATQRAGQAASRNNPIDDVSRILETN